MPNAKGHLIGGIGFFSACALIPFLKVRLPFSSPEKIIVGLLFCLLGALFPDIDTHSEGRKLLNLLIFAGIAIACHRKNFVAALMLAPIPLFAKLASHRGITHNPVFLTIIPAMVIYSIRAHAPWIPEINSVYYYSFLVGAISHIVLDFAQTTLKRFGFLKKSKEAKKKVLRRFWW